MVRRMRSAWRRGTPGGARRGRIRTYSGGDSRGQAAHVAGQTCSYTMEEGENLPAFSTSRSHALLVDVYGDHLHHKNGLHLDWSVTDGTLWQHHWKRLDD